ncbi:MAG: hypothetical protein LBV73_08695 [Paraburkholderia sp.]|nr:hypothetical protein [Paraburkholderia sp.]
MKLETANYSNKIMAVAIAEGAGAPGQLTGAHGRHDGLVTVFREPAPNPGFRRCVTVVMDLTPRIGAGPGGTRIISAP